MNRIIDVLEDMDVKYNIGDGIALVEFWTDTAGQDIPTEFEFDNTPQNFVDQFTYYADSYDVDEQVEMYADMRGRFGVPDTIREILDDCEEAKQTLMTIATALQRAIA